MIKTILTFDESLPSELTKGKSYIVPESLGNKLIQCCCAFQWFYLNSQSIDYPSMTLKEWDSMVSKSQEPAYTFGGTFKV